MTPLASSPLPRGALAWDTRATRRPQPGAARVDSKLVVLIDPDHGFRTGLADYLRSNGLPVIEVEAFDMFTQRVGDHCDAVIVMALGADLARGLGFLKFVGAKYRCPLLVLDERADDTTGVVSLELGADDYIAKSTRPREMLARVRAAIRRIDHGTPDAGAPTLPAASAQGWRFLPGQRDLIAPGGVRVVLTSAEFNLLHVMVRNAGTPLDRDYLSRAVFGRVHSEMDRSVDNLVARLRRKLNDSARTPHIIKTARPIGYVFTGFPGTREGGPAGDAGRAPPGSGAWMLADHGDRNAGDTEAGREWVSIPHGQRTWTR